MIYRSVFKLKKKLKITSVLSTLGGITLIFVFLWLFAYFSYLRVKSEKQTSSTSSSLLMPEISKPVSFPEPTSVSDKLKL